MSNKCEIVVYGEKELLQEFAKLVGEENESEMKIVGEFFIDDLDIRDESIILDAEFNGDGIYSLFLPNQNPSNKLKLENPVEISEDNITKKSYEKIMEEINKRVDRRETLNLSHDREIFRSIFLDRKIDLIIASLIFNLRIEIRNDDYFDFIYRKIIIENGNVIENSFETHKSKYRNSVESNNILRIEDLEPY